MTTNEYVQRVLTTESSNFPEILERSRTKIRLLHSLMGICTEVGELQDQLKKHLFYGKEIDRVNLVEELGDLLWYIALASDYLGVPLEKIMEINIEKLETRYKKKGFSSNDALNRDLATERNKLEKL